jgi:CheY-like chemotaxis protein
VPATILVVDDDAGVQITVQTILEDAGYSVVLASDGLEALARLDAALPALILLDITLPRMNGYQFAEALQRLEQRPRIPIVVLTADGRAQQKAERVRAAGYLAKPFQMNRLLEVVARTLDRPDGPHLS